MDQVEAGRFWAQFYTDRVLGTGAEGTRIDTVTFTGLVDNIAAVAVPVCTVNEVIRPAVA